MKHLLLIFGLTLLLSSCNNCDNNNSNNDNNKTYKFAVICDTRSDANNNGLDGVNIAAVKAVCTHLKESGAEFIIAPGDFICGNVSWYDTIDGPPSNHDQYKAFLDALKFADVSLPNGNGAIKLYPVRGNHECYQQILPEDSIEAAWLKNIGYALPNNGPESEIGFTYSFMHKDALFLALDQYMHASASKKEGISIDQDWVNLKLKEHPNAKHVFAFGHTPVFAAQHQDCLGEDSIARNTFLQSLNNRTGVYFCGHDHFYARAEVPVYDTNETVQNYMQQVITPSGAPFLGGFSPKWDGVYKNQQVKAEKYLDNAVGYQLVTVTNKKVSVVFIATTDASTHYKDDNGKYHYTYNNNWETWNFETMDKFSYKLP